jgi:hypothetical protein
MTLSLFRLFAAGLLIVVALVPPTLAQQQAVGIVKIAEGDVTVLRGATRTPLAVGDAIQVGDQLTTGADGSVGVTLKDGTLLSLGTRSIFVIEEFLFAPERESLSFVGAARAGSVVYTSGTIGRLAPEKVRVTTPFGTIGTRGTRFAVRMPDAVR